MLAVVPGHDVSIQWKAEELVVAKLVILTLEYAEARALLKAAKNTNGNDVLDAVYREALRKLEQEMLRVNPLEKKK